MNVREAIEEAVRDGWTTDTHEIAEKVVGQIPGNQLRAALLELVPEAVRVTQSRFRTGLTRVLSGDEQREATESGFTKTFRGMQLTDLVVHVPVDGEVATRSMRLGDCTADDLEALASGYDKRIGELAVWAARYRRMAALVGDDTVADVDYQVLAQVWGGQK